LWQSTGIPLMVHLKGKLGEYDIVSHMERVDPLYSFFLHLQGARG
jgi:hypothetical protein